MTIASERAARILAVTKKARINFLKFTIAQERALLSELQKMIEHKEVRFARKE